MAVGTHDVGELQAVPVLQHPSPALPQWTQDAALQLLPLLHLLLAQHFWPVPPHATQVPLAQAKPLTQSESPAHVVLHWLPMQA